MEIKLPTVDQLRSMGTPAYFGLGFIQLKVDQTYRFHFYHNSLDAIVPDEEIHDHRYNFKSHVLQGTFNQLLYDFIPDPTGYFELQNVDCQGPTDQVFEKTTGKIKLINRSTYTAGCSYWIDADVLHHVTAFNNAITLLQRDPIKKDYARVARSRNADAVCPFSQPIAESRCWELIENMLPKQS